MATRLVDLYPAGTEVEIKLKDAGWQAAQVIGHEYPGVWVQTSDQMRLFVTNGRHIRLPEGAAHQKE